MDNVVAGILSVHVIAPIAVVAVYHYITTKVSLAKRNEENIFCCLCFMCLIYAFMQYYGLYITYANADSNKYAHSYYGIALRVFGSLGLIVVIALYRSLRIMRSHRKD
jgi:hypothetical protein